MKTVICKQCQKESKKYDREGSVFCNQKCYFNWKKINPNKKAYKEKIFVSGYYYIYMPSHPNAIKNNRYIAEHRYIAEQKIGRYLSKNEIAHHINGIKTDNRIENIEVLTISEHCKLHANIRLRNNYGKYE
jgi:hypothetical protein